MKKLFHDHKLLKRVMDETHLFLAKLMTLNCHTLCFVNGSAVGGGLFILFGHERAIMKNNPRFVTFLPETPMSIIIIPGLMKITSMALTERLARRMIAGTKLNP